MNQDNFDVLIIGSGITGLMAAQTLHPQKSVLLVDKREFVGGRLKTQSVGAGLADIGAQFFTVRTTTFQQLSDKWLAAGLIQPWLPGWSDASLSEFVETPNPRFIVKGGMSSLVEYLAQGFDVRTKVKVETASPADGGWLSRTSSGHFIRSRTLLLTAPVPLSLGLVNAGEPFLSDDDQAALRRVTYEPCLVAVFSLRGEVRMPALGAIQLPQGPIRYLVDNKRKGISPQATLLTVQADVEFSRRHWEQPDKALLNELQSNVENYLQPDASILEGYLYRWRYALPVVIHPDLFLIGTGLPPLLFAGDAFGALRGIEGAVLSGLAAGEALTQLLND